MVSSPRKHIECSRDAQHVRSQLHLRDIYSCHLQVHHAVRHCQVLPILRAYLVLHINPRVLTPSVEPWRMPRDDGRDCASRVAVGDVHLHVRSARSSSYPLLTDASRSFVLYMLYYPPHLKYITPASDPESSTTSVKPLKRPQRTEEWQNSVILAWVTFGHLCVSPPIPCPSSLRPSSSPSQPQLTSAPSAP